MTARADGLWWARHDTTGGGAPWCGVIVDGPKVYIPGWAGPMDVDDEFIEWGPYLGKEPDSIIGLDSLLDHHADSHDLPMVTIGGFMVARVSEDTPHTIKGEKLDQTRADIRSALESAGVLPADEETPTP